MSSEKQAVLKKYFGYSSFRPGQEEMIDAILAGRDVLGIMPTGAGKSICYQVPALMLPGITVVISPLISLMMDQVKSLNQAGVHAAYINSSLTENQISKALSNAARGMYKIVYVAPERLGTWGFRNFIESARISMVTVDEAHCISQWGQDFRPSYLQIADFVEKLPNRPIVSAFTATATDKVREDILRSLRLQDPHKLVTSFDRPNLYFSVKQYKGKEKDLFLLKYVEENRNKSGIIYCATRKNVEAVTLLLREYGVKAVAYHAGMESKLRTDSQNAFIYDEADVVVATNAFGMGIDKSNVRYVIHYNMPQSLENYYQEAGRAGRDGEDAECILLYSPQDIVINRFLINQKESSETREMDEYRLSKMIDYSTKHLCLRNFILGYFGERTGEDCRYCSYCMGEETEPMYVARRSPGYESIYDSGYGSGRKGTGRKTAGKAGQKTGRSAAGKGGRGSGRSRASVQLTPRQEILFDRLRDLRKDIAAKEGVPPYLIFSDRTLVKMCAQAEDLGRLSDMLDISGVGEYKLERYGEDFFDEIQAFLEM